jgi:hypothetical protein
MKKRINYGDNLFLLSLALKDLTAAAGLSVDPDLFLDKIVEDIFFLDGTASKIFELLGASTHLIDRLEHLKSLKSISQSFCGLLEDIRQKRLPLGEHLEHFSEKFELLIQNNSRIAREAARIIQESARQPLEESTIVSESELKFLLAAAPDSARSEGEEGA